MVDSPARFLCVHGHFYQPPRENPWLEAVETEKSASPYHDWNERITDECYAVNLAARILDGSNQIVSIVNNYARFSFNFGPTLLTWLEVNHPEVYTAIIDSDRENAPEYSGHGSALAQAYNHLIMPLANRRDKETQVAWGVSDFRRRFGRPPEGMWLPETAVDLETLDIMAGRGIKFTLLAPHQAARVKSPDGSWHPAGGAIDTSQPYACRLPSGRSISIFFYHPGLSKGVAFGSLLQNGDQLADSVLAAYARTAGPSIITIATDGETYGHHRRFGEMALAYAFDKLDRRGVRITNMAEYLANHPPAAEVEIVENSSWSCDHDVERWRSGCCCSTGSHPGWNQRWRAPLRQAMDLLRDNLNPLFEQAAKELLTDPWAARNDYEEVIGDRSPDVVEAFLKRHGSRQLTFGEKVRALKLLELQRHLMAIYTSCGWFFDDIGGLESVLVMKQAGRALQLADQLFGQSPEREFLNILETAQSNDRAKGSGWDIFEREVRPLIAGLKQAAANIAIQSLFPEPASEPDLYTYSINISDLNRYGDDGLRLSSGDIEISSTVTLEKQRFVFAAMLRGSHEVIAGLEAYKSPEDYAGLKSKLGSFAGPADGAGCREFLEARFAGSVFDLRHLFGDERTVVVEGIIGGTLKEAEAAYRTIYSGHRETMRFLRSLGQAIPSQFKTAAEFVLSTDLKDMLKADTLDLENVETLLNEMKLWEIPPEKEAVSYYLSGQLENILLSLIDAPDDHAAMSTAIGSLQLFKDTILFPNLWRVQNLYFAMFQNIYIGRKDKPGREDWLASFVLLGRLLQIRID
ncbi:Glycosyl hydrolase family 57 [Dehalogenimonas formicexedens]|uniref:Glycosyl hydrolase family 57 n=1 Tax=Dehalogenimonas formicexedens TaxID=1839801 RepID=A0A1P8F7K5_9CHLR|nr:DUF3536 domain-containing protein [Dehalogenimonas formicexedens]APV44451.1 Glycosyl hydrolase family 57 [Dehalogenimonas formicexedens]